MIYLDAAATTLEKPESVRRAMARAVGEMSTPGRGDHPASRLAAETAYQCRQLAAELFDVPDPEHVVFTTNATHGLNIAIRSLVQPGDRVVCSGWEHNAVMRVLQGIGDVEIVVVDSWPFDVHQLLRDVETALQQRPAAVIWNHVSNVFGLIQPVGRIGALCRKAGVPLIVDASQSAGVLPVSLDYWDAAFVAMPGHKGLYGPQGTGLLLCAKEGEPLLRGGTGTQSRSWKMPRQLPDRLEAGTHNMPGIAGLLEGLRFVRQRGTESILRHERELVYRAAEQMDRLPGVRCCLQEDPARQSGVLSFTVEGRDSEELALRLAERGIALRAGLHCAPLAHRTAGTLEGGTVRMSPSVFTTRQQIDSFTKELGQILRESVQI